MPLQQIEKHSGAGSELFKILLAFLPGIFAYSFGKSLGPIFPILMGVGWAISGTPEKKIFAIKVCGGLCIGEMLLSFLLGWGGVWWVSLVGGLFILAVPPSRVPQILRGTKIASSLQLQRDLVAKESKYLKARGIEQPTTPQLVIGGVQLPNYLENLSFGFFGSPGSGKSQSILQILHTLRQRPDWRVFVLDRNAELLEQLFSEGDLIFNPRDMRSVGWSHRSEGANFETIAAGLIPDNLKEPFFSDSARNVCSDLYERTFTNTEMWSVLSSFSMKQLKELLAGSISSRYFEGESGNTAGSVMSTVSNAIRFYRTLAQSTAEANFSFSRWGREDDSRWIFLPLFEDDAEVFKPLFTTAFELMIRGLLSNENRKLKTALVVDELGALSQLKSLPRLLSESRKFGGSAFLGAQTTAQIEEIYGEKITRIILQGAATKLVLNCRDHETADLFSKLIGTQERIDTTQGTTDTPGQRQSRSRTEQIRETPAVLPSELQNLPPLEGYLVIADSSTPAKVTIEPKNYPKKTARFVELI